MIPSVHDINVRFHNIKDAIRGNFIKLDFNSTEFNKADLLMKCLSYYCFIFLRKYFMIE